MRQLIPLSLLGLALACSSDPDKDATTVDSGVPNEDGGVDPGGPVFELSEVVEGLNSEALVGDFAVLRVKADGTPALAYGYYAVGDVEAHIHYAEKTAGGWDIDDVIEVGINGRRGANVSPPIGTLEGIGFDFVGGVPHISYFGGDFDNPQATSPGPNISDLMLSTKNGNNWTERTLVNVSSDVNYDCTGGGITDPYCQVGFDVGTNSALAARPGGGFGVAYRDIHIGFADQDFESADCEYYGEGGGPGPGMIDAVRSGGVHTSLVFNAQGNPVASYLIPTPRGTDDRRIGIWVGYWDGTEFKQVQVAPGTQTASRTSLALAPDGTLYLAYLNRDTADLEVATSTDDGATWTTTDVDESGKTGLHPAMAVDGQGRPVVAYTYCGVTSDRDCPGSLGSKSEVRLARLEGGTWKKYRIDNGQGFGGVGLFVQLRVGPDGKLHVAFQDPTNNDLVYVKEQ